MNELAAVPWGFGGSVFSRSVIEADSVWIWTATNNFDPETGTYDDTRICSAPRDVAPLLVKAVNDRAALLAALEGVMDLVVAHTQAQDERVLAALKALQHAKESL